PVFGAYRLCKLLILLDRIFEKTTFHTVWCVVRGWQWAPPWPPRPAPRAPDGTPPATDDARHACPASPATSRQRCSGIQRPVHPPPRGPPNNGLIGTFSP